MNSTMTKRKAKKIAKKLIAPCGMNCSICSKYLSYLNNLKRSQCSGCKPSSKRCDYLFAKCRGINHGQNKKSLFCFECSQYPCKQIDRMDARYRKSYRMSIKDNLDEIQKRGIDEVVESQYRKYCCADCGGVVSIHNRKCFRCDTVTRLIEKFPDKR